MGKIVRIEELPGDLLAAVVLAVATLLFTLLSPLSYTPVRIPLGLLMVLFVPGYTLIAALFPRKGDLDGIERVALSFGLSIAVVPLMGLGLNYTPWGIRLTPVVVSISLFTLAMSVISYIRRTSLPIDERFSVEFRKNLASARAEVMADEKSRVDKALTIILILSIILSVSALVYVIVTPKQGEKFTEFYILGPKGKAYDYPTRVLAGNKSTVIVGVVNHEYSLVNYTMNLNFDNSTILEDRLTLEHNQTWEHPVTYVLNHPGDEQKLEFLLYKEDNFTAPYRDLHLWVNVSSGNISGGKETALITNIVANANTSAVTSSSESSSAGTIPNLNITPALRPVSPPLDDGSGGSGGESYGPSGAGLDILIKGERQNAANISAMLGPGANMSQNISEGNRSKTLQGNNASNVTSASDIINVSHLANISANEFLESNLSKVPAALNVSYNASNRPESQAMKPAVQASRGKNAVPVQLGSKTPNKVVMIGSINHSLELRI
ncbi:MAG: DUF1616 domain-containing protein [Methanotrichaceae archaeon]